MGRTPLGSLPDGGLGRDRAEGVMTGSETPRGHGFVWKFEHETGCYFRRAQAFQTSFRAPSPIVCCAELTNRTKKDLQREKKLRAEEIVG